MAKHTALARPIVISMPRRSGGRLRRAGRRVAHVARRAARSRHMPGVAPIALLLGSAAVGYAEGKGYTKKLPQIGGSAALTFVLAGYLGSKYGRHQYLKAAGYAMMAVGAFEFAKVQAGGTSGLDEQDEFGERAV